MTQTFRLHRVEDFEPLGDRVLISPIKRTDQYSKGGLYIPEVAQERTIEAEVLAVGPGALNARGDLVPMRLSVGDVVMYAKHAGIRVEIGGAEMLLLHESDVYGVIKRPQDKEMRDGQAA